MLYGQLLSSIESKFGEKINLLENLSVDLPTPHEKQILFINSPAKRKIIRAGRRSGKTEGAAILAVNGFKGSRRILYATPVSEQIDRFWKVVTKALAKPVEDGLLYKNETLHLIELPRTEFRIRAKTAWNADTLRGDYCDLLILDEWQGMDEDAWELVGAPMLLDNNGDAIFFYTPPSLHSKSASKAKDPQHAGKMYAKAKQDETGRWAAFHFTSHDNPYVSKEALSNITKDMTTEAILMEIMAQDETEAQGSLWKREMIEKYRVVKPPMKDVKDNGHVTQAIDLRRIVVAIDPSATSTGNEAGIIASGKNGEDAYVLADESIQGSPLAWATAAVTLYHRLRADRIVAEANNGGEMVELTIRQVDPRVPVTLVHASRGKQTRAEPIAAQYERGKVHHVGNFEKLEDEMCLWCPGDESPNRMDALVWSLTELMLSPMPGFFFA
jgi:hypothetical protein